MLGNKQTVKENEDLARQVTQHFNSLVHADPQGARYQSIKSADGLRGYSASKSLADTEKCDEICFQAAMYLIVLTSRAVAIFPEALVPDTDFTVN